ncbi:hypothetical protein HZP91_15400 [Elizabethkingia anophelis]|nr:hypothetical protein [Elizabethkingia anophelis]
MYNTIYYIEYFDAENDLVRIDIKKDNFIGIPKEIHGTAVVNYEDRKDLFKSILASTLQLDLEANVDLTLSDLYSEDEKTFSVECKKSDRYLFKGFIKPDGIWADLVSDSWVISMDCIDGLSTLKDISFKDDFGDIYSGTMPINKIIYNCLKKTGLDLPINYFIDLKLDSDKIPSNKHFLDEVYMNTFRYYQDSKNQSSMSCEDVLKSVLSLFSATVFQNNGEWFIIRIPSVDTEILGVRRYVSGVYSNTYNLDLSTRIGSDINGYYPHHINANQRQTILPSIQTFRVKLQFGTLKGILNNPTLINNGLLPIEFWNTEIDSDTRPLPNNGIEADVLRTEQRKILLTNKTFNGNNEAVLASGDVVTFNVEFYNIEWSIGLRYRLETPNYVFRNGQWESKGSGNSDHYDTVENFDWGFFSDGSNQFLYKKGRGSAVFELKLPPVKENGSLTIKIFRDWYDYNSGSPIIRDGYTGVTMVNISPSETDNKKGEYYFSQRKKKISTVVKEDTTLYNGDSQSTIYHSALTFSDGTPTTATWRRLDRDLIFPENRALISFIPEDVLRCSFIPAPVIEGDLLGYIPFINTVISTDLIQMISIFNKYSYDTLTCQLKCNIRQIFPKLYLNNDEYRNDTPYEVEPDFGEETKVTIKS